MSINTINGYELYEVTHEFITADLIVWQRYRNRAPRILEKMLDSNPQLAMAHRVSPFLPVGLMIRIPIDNSLLAGVPPKPPELWTDIAGYQN